MQLIITYSLISALSIIINLLCQVFLLKINISLFLAIIFGTVIGLFIKYILDAKYIFLYKKTSISNFAKYSFMGGLITPIWWVFEYGSYYVFGSNNAAICGGFFGLIICYFLKYNLDKNYVFK